jgi:EAL domain-containing protein (putative c-di-GMP-specific phosphodiesterase class I)
LYRNQIEQDLRVALDEQQFYLLYQPKVDVDTGRIHGAEALVRWQHPIRGMVSPLDFISIAEESGSIVGLGDWVLDEACRQARLWSQDNRFDPTFHISVNVSALQFIQDDFASKILTCLAKHGLEGSKIDLEVTETLMLNNIEGVVEKMNILREEGITFSIDDFGTGYSSLSYLKELPVDVLKVDQSFVRDMITDSNDSAIVKTILAMADSLKLKTVAEGVETLEHLQVLQALGCSSYQGYLFSPPINAEKFEDLIKKG